MNPFTKEEIADLQMLLKLKDIIVDNTKRAQSIIFNDQSKTLEEIHEINRTLPYKKSRRALKIKEVLTEKITLPNGSVFNSEEKMLKHFLGIAEAKIKSFENQEKKYVATIDSLKERLNKLGKIYSQEKDLNTNMLKQLIFSLFNHTVLSENRELAKDLGQRFLEYSKTKKIK